MLVCPSSINPYCIYQVVNWRSLGGTLAPSSSGPGYLVLIQKIAGSNPAGVTK